MSTFEPGETLTAAELNLLVPPDAPLLGGLGGSFVGLELGSGIAINSGTVDISAGIATIIAGGVSITSSPIFPALVGQDVPDATGFDFVNQSDATLVNVTNGPLVFQTANNPSSNLLRFAEKVVPSGSWTLTAHVRTFLTAANNTIMLGLNDGTKAIFLGVGCGNTDSPVNPLAIFVQHWNGYNSASGSGTPGGPVYVTLPGDLWLRIVYGSATPSLTYEYSPDGFTWVELYSESGSLFLTPANFFIGTDPNGNIGATAPFIISADYLTIG
jgi:hypothetical protein